MSKKILPIISLWFLITFCWVLKNEYTLNTGREVLLETVPVDPRDLFMGDYVILSFKISQPNFYLLKKYNKEKPVYVYLEVKEKNIARYSKMSQIEPELHDKGLYIKGKIKNNRIIYGIENYYVKEKTGKILEKELRNGALVKVKIDKYGNAKVIGFVDK